MLEADVVDCPFKEPGGKDCEVEKENVKKDDKPGAAVDEAQDNDGGTLGRNLQSGSLGSPATVNDKFPYNGGKKRDPEKRVDTRRTNGKQKVSVKGDGTRRNYTVAAHHCIPGEASLHKSELFMNYMAKHNPSNEDGEEEGRVEFMVGDAQKSFKIEFHIGYNVNGSHNGVWLPGNYAIRGPSHSPGGVTWGVLVEDPTQRAWCLAYMTACVAKTGGQFHDSHEEYNRMALRWLEKISTALMNHHPTCNTCQTNEKLPPPYAMKERLYLFSAFLKLQVTGHPMTWKTPWITSDKFKAMITVGGTGRITQAFIDAYTAAVPDNPSPA
jgi:hypothetical protein